MSLRDKKTREFLLLTRTPIITNLLFFVIGRGAEGFLMSSYHHLDNLWGSIILAVIYDLPVFAIVSLLGITLMLVVFPIDKKVSLYCGIFFVFIFHLFHLPILYFFILTFTPLDRLVFAHSWQEIITTIKTAGINYKLIVIRLLFFVVVFAGVVWSVSSLKERVKFAKSLFASLLVLSVLAAVFGQSKPGSFDYRRQMIYLHKSAFFYTEVYRHFFSSESNPYLNLPKEYQIQKYHQLFPAHEYFCTEYPFMIRRNVSNPLGSFFPESENPPTVVLIIVEGLGNDFLDSNSPMALMPFLDSLRKESLYWDHFLGVGERSYAVLPAMIGSLPHGEIGFSLLRDMPLHLTLVNQLSVSGYKTGFYYGQGGYFHAKYAFLKRNNIDVFVDKSDYGKNFEIIVDEHSGYHWGYHDQALFRNYFKTRETDKNNLRLDIFFTGTMHSPFIIDQEEYYDEKYQLLINASDLTPDQRSYYNQYERYLKTLLFTDDALRYFFDEYSRLEGFDNTIFIITGDHPMTEVPIQSLLKRYHVPLILYSPMLQKSQVISSISSQFDVMPAIMNLLEQNFGVFAGEFGHMFGTPIDTIAHFSSRAVAPLMRGNRTVDEIVVDDYFLSGNTLFTIKENMELVPLVDPEVFSRLSNMLHAYNIVNNKVVETGKLVSDSIFAVNTGLQIIKDTLISFKVNSERQYYDIFQLPLEDDLLQLAFGFIRGDVADACAENLPTLIFELRDADNKVLRWKPMGLQTFPKSSVPNNVRYFNRFLELDHDFFVPGGKLLNVYLWNEHGYNIELINLEFKLFSSTLF
ncbi:MAG: LTA synthase family protein [Bacteroidetes bacterium]|nr:MAG: LTA synthase family protein [Bacteroidota bacterium]